MKDQQDPLNMKNNCFGQFSNFQVFPAYSWERDSFSLKTA